MRKITLVCFVTLFTLALGRSTFAQDASNAQQATKAQDNTQAAPVHYYHLDFVIEELDSSGKPVNSRTYSTTICTQPHSSMSIRTGSKIPIATGSYGETNAKTVNTQFQYEDVGVNIDARNAREIDRQLALDLTAEVSGVADSSSPNLPHEPVIRQNRWQALVLIPVGKSTVVFASDSIDSKGSTRVLVTATPLQ
jgi:type II secretory pathway component GspD/PulD (secretin)